MHPHNVFEEDNWRHFETEPQGLGLRIIHSENCRADRKILDKSSVFYVISFFRRKRSRQVFEQAKVNQMVVDFTTLLQGTHQFTVTLTPAWWQSRISDPQVIALEQPVIASVTVFKEQTGYVLEGRVSGALHVMCGRCLEPLVHVLKPEFRLEVTFASPPSDEDRDVELLENDFIAATGDEGEVDLQELVMEQILLSLPITFLCGEDCQGLCAECGMNLNRKKCDCRKPMGHPAFLKLKKLEFREE